MQRRRLGRTEIEIAPMVFGGNVFGWTADEATSCDLLDRFVAAGGNCIDTANVYSAWAEGHSGGESETVIGSWLKRRGRRDEVVIATKVGMKMGDGSKGLAPDYIRRSLDDSLRRLGTDYVDLYQAHEDDPTVPLEETLGAFAELIEAGKVRAIGASNYEAPRLQEALDASARLGLPRYETLQPHYNLRHRQAFEAAQQPLCRREEIGVIPYFGLARGFLTGKYRSKDDIGQSVRGSGVVDYLDARGRAILEALDAVAAEQRATPAQVALAWLMARPTVAGPIVSATKPAQLEDNLKALGLELTADQTARLDAASAGG